MESILLIGGGDITGGGTVERYDVRAPAVLQAFKQTSIFFGAAFSSFYFKYADGHVGFHTFLFNTGILGFFLLLVFLFSIIFYPLKILKQPFMKNSNKSIKIFSFIIIGLCLLNNSTQYFGYEIELPRIFAFAFILSFYNEQINKLVNENISLRISSKEYK